MCQTPERKENFCWSTKNIKHLQSLENLEKKSWQSGHIQSQRGMNLKAAAGIKSIAQWENC